MAPSRRTPRKVQQKKWVYASFKNPTNFITRAATLAF